MPRYFFSLSDGVNILVDFKGQELSGPAEACERAVNSISNLLDHGAHDLSNERPWDIEVTAEDGSLVAILPFPRRVGTMPRPT